MSKNVVKNVVFSILAVLLLSAGVQAAKAATVYYQGVAVYWGYGRSTSGLYSYSEVSTKKFQKKANANGNSSGWVKSTQGNAYADKLIGYFTRAECYWNCSK